MYLYQKLKLLPDGMKNIDTKTPHILILGAKGMLGRTVFNYFKKRFPSNTWGTDKSIEDDKNLLSFEAKKHKTDFKNLISQIGKTDYVINCIGILNRNKSLEELISVNSFFPHVLERYAEKYKFKLIHVSSDAVFPKLAGPVTEKSNPSPEDAYGISKMLGETTLQNAITIRTSIMGFDPYSHHGLLEWARQHPNKNINGYVNQTWSGCTTLQFATLCKWLITNNQFSEIRKFSKVIHFPPLRSSKYDILKNYLSLLDKKYFLKKVKGVKITRYLKSEYFDLKMLKMYNINIYDALVDLISFENDNAYKK